MIDRLIEPIDPLEEKLRTSSPQEEEGLTVEEALLANLNPLLEDRLLDEIVRPIKAGKEAVVYCCRAGESLGGSLVAAKIYRPIESRSFKRDSVYQQGRERGAKPDARVLRALGKKTQGARLHRFSAWIGHEMETLRILHQAGAAVPEPFERVGPVIVMSYVGDADHPAPVLSSVEPEQGVAEALYRTVLHNVEAFLRHHRVHADLSAFNILYWGGSLTIIDFPQAVDPRYNDDAFDLLVRDIKNVNEYFADQGVSTVDPIDRALSLWRQYVDPNR
jgi:RIO kinase 1